MNKIRVKKNNSMDLMTFMNPFPQHYSSFRNNFPHCNQIQSNLIQLNCKYTFRRDFSYSFVRFSFVLYKNIIHLHICYFSQLSSDFPLGKDEQFLFYHISLNFSIHFFSIWNSSCYCCCFCSRLIFFLLFCVVWDLFVSLK